jgi:hypothetical protein
MLDRKRKAHDLVRRNLGRAAERRKRYYDQNVRPKSFKTGSWVWYFYPRRYRGKSPKWQRHYVGPYLITREIPPCNFVIQKSSRSKPLVAHVDKLKEYFGVPPPSWLTEEQDLPVTEGSLPDTPVDIVVPENTDRAVADSDDNVSQNLVPIDGGGLDSVESPGEDSDNEVIPVDVSPAGRQLRRPDQRRRPARYL